MTNSLRANESALLQPNALGQSTIDPSTSVSGTVWVPVPFVKVEWAWLLMPAILYVLVWTLLFITMTRSSLRGLGVWKSSPLAFMLHGLPEGEQKTNIQSVASARPDKMQSSAEKVNVKLALDHESVLCLLPE